MRLLKVELRRYFSRRLIRIGLLAGLVFLGMASFGMYQSSMPPTEHELDQARESYEYSHELWLEEGDEWLAECLESEALDREDDPTLDYGCDDMEPKLEDFFWHHSSEDSMRMELLYPGAAILILITLGAAISFMAAEFTTGNISTWLTFEPRRMRVFLSKMGAVIVATAVIMAVGFALLWGASLAISTLNDLEPAAAGDYSVIDGSPMEFVIRASILGVIVAMIGVAVASVIRHTAGALAVIGGYVIFEQIYGGVWDAAQRFLLLTHVQGVLEKGTYYYSQKCETTQAGTTCNFIEVPIAYSTSLIVVGVVAVVLIIIGAWNFRRRDVI